MTLHQAGMLPIPCARSLPSEQPSRAKRRNDFAYAFLDYHQVVGVAGCHVADDWLRTRAGLKKAYWQQEPGSPKATPKVQSPFALFGRQS